MGMYENKWHDTRLFHDTSQQIFSYKPPYMNRRYMTMDVKYLVGD